MAKVNDHRRYFILTAGRTGSTLLAAMLADAGADFGLQAPEDWEVARGGDMEHPEVRRAANRFRIAFERSARKPVTIPSKWLWTYQRAVGKRHLRNALRQARFVKAVNLDLAIPHTITLGFFPVILVSCRPFSEFAISYSQMLASRALGVLAEDYDRTYRNALLYLYAFGGCVINYADLTDRGRTEWAQNLETVTGLSAAALLASRDRRARATPSLGATLPELFESTARSFALTQALSRAVVPASPEALRNWAQRVRDGSPRSDTAAVTP